MFVHARSATVRTAHTLLEIARANGETSFFSSQEMEGFYAANKLVNACSQFYVCKTEMHRFYLFFL